MVPMGLLELFHYGVGTGRCDMDHEKASMALRLGCLTRDTIRGILNDAVRYLQRGTRSHELLAHYPSTPANPPTILTTTGTLVNPTITVPNSDILKLLNAAARGSLINSNAVAIALLFPPNVTPLVT